MTTITALNVRLGMDASNFSAGADLARTEVNRVATILRQSVPPAEKFKAELDLLNRAFSETGKQSAQYANAVEHLKRKHEGVATAIHATTRATTTSQNAAESAIGSIKGMAAAYLSVQAVTSTLSKSITLANEVEDATIAFEVLTGSVKDGAKLFEQIRTFAAESPITFSGATEATKTMLSFGVAAQDVQKNLQMLSDVTGGNNDRFKMLALAFSQTTAAGRLMGQDLLQMVNAGFNPLQQISKTTGESLVNLKKRMEDGGISAEEVRQAFEDATSEGGMFHGMTERLAETVSGKLNIALSDLEKALADVGKELSPLISQILDAFQQLKPVISLLTTLVGQVAKVHGLTIALITDMINSIKTFSIDTTATDKFYADMVEKEKKLLEDAKARIDDEFEQKVKAANDVAKVQNELTKEEVKAQERATKQIAKDRADALMDEFKAMQAAEKAWDKELEEARKDAMDFFKAREKKNDEIRKDVAKGPGSGFEVGSVDAAKFSADVVNRGISSMAVPEEGVIRQREIAEKTAELLIEQRAANTLHKHQVELAEKILAEAKDNKFTRFR